MNAVVPHMSLDPGWLILSLTFPSLGLLLLCTGIGRRYALACLPWAPLPALAAALLAPPDTTLALPDLFAGVMFRLDGTARAFLLPAALLWTLAGWYAATAGGLRRGPVFAGFWLLALSGNLGLILAGDLYVFYIGFALMTFAAYGLVVHEGTGEALRAGRWYLAMMFAGELCLFTAVALVAVAVGGGMLAFTAVGLAPGRELIWALFAFGFALKLGLAGLHAWLPLAHPVAPVPASAVLSGVMIKAGILGWWRVTSPHGALVSDWGPWLMALGLITVFYGVLSGLNNRDPKTVLAWSSVSQMGLIALLAGLALAEPGTAALAWMGITWFVMHHALAKGALFLGTGLFQGSNDSQRRWLLLLLCVPALSLAGVPYTSGWIAKAALDLSLTDSGYGPWLSAMLTASIAGTTLLMAHYLQSLWRTPRPNAPSPGAPWLPWGLAMLCLASLPWTGWAPEYIPPIEPSPVMLAQDLWPVALGLALFFALFAGRSRKFRWPGWRVARAFEIRASAVWVGLSRLEQRMHRWATVGGLFMVLAAILLSAVWLGV
ncbi:hypothetical protein B1C78_14365 [Thioalkalivibrio denitrificans]|uniref:NADH:quinone oxidoreductase/Mrp antiporter transmembrane domain-containing protein n=1 Tax=Thioalkalivibrio denitrificans TaxID=108003 RepID=A0A1V3NCX4_9GAMM|nr:complex I subunit 5 family protein [Thioalkalivibrio denitrificans]OOG22712.1 hypothetical protein B1C78_14365 [Thioalkalivibrio denitrificans]